MILVVVVLAVGVAAALLARTMAAAQSINKKAAVIAETGRGINTATDSILQLERTNELASSILVSAQPLEASLTKIVNSATTIDGLAASINDTAGTINATAGDVNATPWRRGPSRPAARRAPPKTCCTGGLRPSRIPSAPKFSVIARPS